MNETAQRRIFFFGAGAADGGEEMREYVGGKGASLAAMTKAGLPVPPGFTISSNCCRAYFDAGKQWPAGLQDDIRANLTRLEELVQRPFGAGPNPLLVAVRSGAAVSMPGMMDTILNVGLNPDCVRAMAQETANPRNAWEAYRHFLVTFGETVGGVQEKVFERIVIGFLQELDLNSEEEMDAAQMEELCARFRKTYRRHCDRELPIDPHELLFQSIESVFASWHSERATAYRRQKKIADLHGTAVNVQMMCPSEISGVLFTAHPVNPDLKQMVIESTFGLGDAVVLGKVTPDRYVIDKDNGQIVERRIADKRTVIKELEVGNDQVSHRETPSLSDEQVRELIQFGSRVEAYFQHPCDIEWAFSRGAFYMLQTRRIQQMARPRDDELEKFRQAEIARLRTMAEPDGTVWSRYNLAEILAEPTPMTWAIVKQFMSGGGGFGQMYRDLGFDPSPDLEDDGIFDLICGRPYCNLSREPKMQFRQLPFEHPIDKLKENPNRALYPVASFNPRKASWQFWVMVPVLFVKLFRSALRLRRMSRNFAQDFEQDIAPAFLDEVTKEEKSNYHKLDSAALLDRLRYWIKRTLYDFGRHSLKPTALAAIAMSNLERALARMAESESDPSHIPGQEPPLPETLEGARGKMRALMMDVKLDSQSDVASALRDLAQGKINQETLLERFGHRGQQEMELSEPRWAEQPGMIQQMFAGAAETGAGSAEQEQPKCEPSTNEGEEAKSPFASYCLSTAQRQALEKELAILHSYMRLRETAKHHLMRGYFLIRKILLELDQRYRLDGGIFFLTPDELPGLLSGKDFSKEIARRRYEHQMLISIPVPPVIFSDNLEAIGKPLDATMSNALQGVPLSAGVVEGIALVLEKPPSQMPAQESYILVCPSTDPAWMPLFVNARGIVMETGGMLSHGAIVAREFGLPAIAGLPDIHRRIKSGQRLQVDGSTGMVNILE